METKLTTGCIVKFKEVVDKGDETSTFLVIDDFGDDSDRCKVRLLDSSLSLPPTYVYLKDDLYVTVDADTVIEIKLSDAEFLVTLGKKIQSARKKIGITQVNLAEKAGLDRSYISGIESGKKNISVLNLRTIIKILGIQNIDIRL